MAGYLYTSSKKTHGEIILKRAMFNRIIIGLSYYVVFILIDRTVILIAAHSPARNAYGILSSWWAVLYLCAYLDISSKHIWCLIVLGIPYSAYLASRRHDIDYSILGNMALLLFLLSPFILNLLLKAFKKLFTEEGAILNQH